MQRRLAAILAADVVGYSHLMEADEADTLARLKAIRKDLIDPRIAAHGGRIVKLMGDGALVEFASVVDAVECAVEIQRAMSGSGAPAADGTMELRIGVNLGDVIVDGEDIYGEGVNVAARLERLAQPGDVLISGAAFDQVESKMPYRFESLGKQHVKNLDKPVRVYRLLPEPHGPRTATATRADLRRWRWPTIAAAAVLVLAGAFAIQDALQPDQTPAEDAAATATTALPLPDKPSIAVLPFANMSSDASQEFFVDGMTDDLITDLSKASNLFVIARNSAFAYKGKPVNIGQVGRELGVKYVLEGSVQRSGKAIRVNAQLIDASTGGHVWADRFHGDLDDVFAVQDEIVSKIVQALKVNLSAGERNEIARAKTANIQAKDAFNEGWNLHLRFNAKDNAAAVGPLERAIELDPTYGRAYAALAMVYVKADTYAWLPQMLMNMMDYERTVRGLLDLAKQYPTGLAYTAEALWHEYSGRPEEALRAAGQAIALDPNDPEGHIAMAWALTISGKPEQALDFVASAMRLDPNYPSHYVLARGTALFAANRIEQAAEIFSDGIERNPEAVSLLPPFASVLVNLGRRDEARTMLLKWKPGVDQATLAGSAATYRFPFYWGPKHARVRERLVDGVKIAALPLEITPHSLTASLSRTDPFGRQLAIRQLGWFGPASAEAVPSLIELLDDELARKDALETLRKIGPPAKTAVPALIELQNESVIGSYARDALREIRGY